MASALRPGLERRLRREMKGEALFDPFSRGRYATDASFYQIMPVGTIIPRDLDDVRVGLDAAREEKVSVLPRGGGTSQCGQTVNDALVIDGSKHLNRLLDLDTDGGTCAVEPGMVLDELNRTLRPHGLWFPVDVSTASRATIGGMAGNNSCGARSLHYGTMRDNVTAIEAILADGSERRFAPAEPGSNDPLLSDLLAIGRREADEIAARFPDVPRRVGGYNLDAVVPSASPVNPAHLLVGSEGTLAYSTRIELKLSPLPGPRVLGVCHFPTFRAAMEAAQHLVALDPTSVELVDRTMIALARDIDAFRPTVERFVRGKPDALLLVEFDAGEANDRRLAAVRDVMADLGEPEGVVEVRDPALQAAISEVRRSGLNIMMSMREAGKPVSFVEDCAVPLEHLADYTERLTQIFERHGTRGTWYAHASVGCLHVRPVLNLKQDLDVARMRAIAEEAFEIVRAYKGSHSGEHGDGIVRSEFHEPMFGARITRAFEEVKDRFDPSGLLNPGRIVRPPKMDDRRLFRYGPGYGPRQVPETSLDWSGWPGGFLGAVEMCNNNGACRKLKGGAMCPSYRATRDERDVTRGRANTLRLALTGQLGPNALTSDGMWETLKLCVSCKACKRECPTGVDMARMKVEVMRARNAARGLSAKDRLVAYLPRYAPRAARAPWLMNMRDRLPGLARGSQSVFGFAAERSLPRWSRDPFRDDEGARGRGAARSLPFEPNPVDPGPPPEPNAVPLNPEGSGADTRMAAADPSPGLAPSAPTAEVATDGVVLFADTFNRWFEPENLRAAVDVLCAAGHDVEVASGDGRPLCCGRTFLSVGLVEEARKEAERTLEALAPHVEAGRAVIGLEPSCLLTMRDEFPGLLPGHATDALAARALMFEEFLAAEADAGTLSLDLAPREERALLHGHCHQKAFGVMSSVERVLRLVPGLKVEPVESSCCGMAGSFGYDAETIEVSKAMAELSLLPAIREAPDALVVADGTSCRHQIADGARREAVHVARVLAEALA